MHTEYGRNSKKKKKTEGKNGINVFQNHVN